MTSAFTLNFNCTAHVFLDSHLLCIADVTLFVNAYAIVVTEM
jgi:hypothetical protein